jgi:hypothetical protein
MINLICGLVAMVIITLFLGGLGHSIWDNTGSIAFPIIVLLVLIMAYKGFIEELKSGPDHT